MIISFGNGLAEDLFEDKKSKSVRSFSPELIRIARRKLLYLHDAAELKDLMLPAGNRLELLKGDLKGYYSIRINNQWRLVFKWNGSDAFDVKIIDYHK